MPPKKEPCQSGTSSLGTFFHRFKQDNGPKLRKKENQGVPPPPPLGAVAVHQAAGRVPPPEKPQQLQREMPSKLAKGECACHRCLRKFQIASDDGYWMGKNKSAFVCKCCSALDNRITRMVQGTEAQTLWKDMSAADKSACRAEKGELEAAALKDALSVLLVQKKIESDNTEQGNEGEYLPLSVYQNRGYDKDWIEYITDFCPVRELSLIHI